MIKDYINDSETFGMKGLCRSETLRAFFSDEEIKEALMNGEIWNPRPGFFKVCE